jgi:aminoglycoside phosphotransferase (APT) family kinase protein
MMDVIAAVSDLVRSHGFDVTEPVDLRSTNNVVVWLAPSPVVAKISMEEERSIRELELVRALDALDAPVVAPIEVGVEQPWRAGGRSVTFWRHESQDDARALGAGPVAEALVSLHSKLALIDGRFDLPSFDERLMTALHILDQPRLTPDLAQVDRLLLRSALVEGMSRLAAPLRSRHLLHGSPHMLNILSVDGAPTFIDFETVEYGPLEWDLAHLEPEVADLYAAEIDYQVLAECRVLVSAATSTWCWKVPERESDMRSHAVHHLESVRSAMG